MAQRTQVVLVDDLDGSPADETVAFGLDGTSYEIDLTGAHAHALRDVLEPYLRVARRVSGSPPQPPRPARNRNRKRTATMAEIEAVKARARADRA